ncbi:DUF1015 domain-containing protein [Lactococcus sp.]|uniref:DUF1015 domain-containing protein n=1 Tax=Lactococcus sp. TaxID=44273 RepID=UPI0035B4B391
MVVLRAFKAIRPEQKLAQDVATLPYDVLSSKEARQLGQDNPYSFLHIDKSEIDLPSELDQHDEQVYQQALSALTSFLAKGWLKKADQNQLYLYELTMDGRTQTGIVGTTAVSDYENGLIKRHEYTLPEKEQDRIRHFETTQTNTSPIFLTYRSQESIQKIMSDWKNQHQAEIDFVSFYGVRHRVFVIDDKAVITSLERAFAAVPALYIADGHHRTASANKVGKMLDSTEAQYFLSVIFPDDELEILDYNRVVKTALPSDFWKQVAQKFDIEPVEKSRPAGKHQIHAFTKSEGWQKLTVKAENVPNDEVNSLDVAILQNEILAPLLQIDNPKTNPNIAFVGGIRGIDALEKEVNAGASIAFAMFPPAMEELLAVADAKKIMPPKSTWFEPKLLSGLFLHDLND